MVADNATSVGTLRVAEMEAKEISTLDPAFQPLVASGNITMLTNKLEVNKSDMVSLEKAIDILKIPDLALPAFPKKADLLKGFQKQLKKLKKKAAK